MASSALPKTSAKTIQPIAIALTNSASEGGAPYSLRRASLPVELLPGGRLIIGRWIVVGAGCRIGRSDRRQRENEARGESRKQALGDRCHCFSQAWNRASLQGSESSGRCSFMQALIRPWPGGTWLQKRAMSGLHAPSTARAAGFTLCAIAAGAESSKTTPMITNLFFMVCLLHFSSWV